MLFHYDGNASEWDQFEWSQRAIHATGLKQTKWLDEFFYYSNFMYNFQLKLHFQIFMD